jgi:hypothetical protein
MRCWVFDWPGTYAEKAPPGSFHFPDLDVLHPGRRWVFDDEKGQVWIKHQPVLANEAPKRLLPASGVPPVSEADVLAAIEEKWPKATVVRPKLLPGERHPRIWRGAFSLPTPAEVQSFVSAERSAELLRERFRHVLMTIEPEPENRPAFGHELRQLLILASTEVESAWRSVLLANGYPPPRSGRFTTNEYCDLIGPLRLEEWEVDLAQSPRYGSVAPFRGWDPQRPTESLAWYADQHATKHDREVNLAKATLGNVISAMAALEVMLAAQMGPDGLPDSDSASSAFRLVGQPTWELEDQYLPPLVANEIKLVHYSFPP